MTVLSAQTIRELGILIPCMPASRDTDGNSRGLSACGYDLTLDQNLRIPPMQYGLFSAAERFVIPDNVVGFICDKSSLIRRGLRMGNTVAEPGWRGYLTLEPFNASHDVIEIQAGCAIAQVVFHFLDESTRMPYEGKYQDQAPGPQEAR